MKETCKTINEHQNKRSKSSNIDCIKDSGNAIINKKEISNTINRFFCTIGENLTSKIETVPNPLLSGGWKDCRTAIRNKNGGLGAEPPIFLGGCHALYFAGK